MDRWYTVIDKWRSGETNSKTDDVDIMNTNRKENSFGHENHSAQDSFVKMSQGELKVSQSLIVLRCTQRKQPQAGYKQLPCWQDRWKLEGGGSGTWIFMNIHSSWNTNTATGAPLCGVWKAQHAKSRNTKKAFWMDPIYCRYRPSAA